MSAISGEVHFGTHGNILQVEGGAACHSGAVGSAAESGVVRNRECAGAYCGRTVISISAG